MIYIVNELDTNKIKLSRNDIFVYTGEIKGHISIDDLNKTKHISEFFNESSDYIFKGYLDRIDNLNFGIDVAPEFKLFLAKELFWSNNKRDLVNYLVEKYNAIDLTNYSKLKDNLKSFVKIVYELFTCREKKVIYKLSNRSRFQNTIYFFNIDSFLLEFYKQIIFSFRDKNLVFFSLKPFEHEVLKWASQNNFYQENCGVIIQNSFHKLFLLLIKNFFKKGIKLDQLLKLYKDWNSKSKLYSTCFNSNSKIIGNILDYDGNGVAIGFVARKKNCHVYNFMNGTINFNLFHSGNYFDTWFVHDNVMGNLIREKLNFKNKIYPFGHLLQELAINYKFKNTINVDVSNFNSKNVISFFTSFFYQSDQIKVFNLLIKKIRQLNLVILIKKHPSDKSLWIQKFVDNTDIFLIKSSKNDTMLHGLFDLFSISDLTISFNSTISYQSLWFGLPAINFGNNDSLYYSSFEGIYSINDLNELDFFLEKFDFKKPKIPKVNKEISKKIVEIINE